jgi:hypothetical protein
VAEHAPAPAVALVKIRFLKGREARTAVRRAIVGGLKLIAREHRRRAVRVRQLEDARERVRVVRRGDSQRAANVSPLRVVGRDEDRSRARGHTLYGDRKSYKRHD